MNNETKHAYLPSLRRALAEIDTLVESRAEVAAQRDELAAVLRKIMNAHNSGNNGAYMGEAHVCRAFAIQANEALAKVSA
jgi:hypothetical protein